MSLSVGVSSFGCRLFPIRKGASSFTLAGETEATSVSSSISNAFSNFHITAGLPAVFYELAILF